MVSLVQYLLWVKSGWYVLKEADLDAVCGSSTHAWELELDQDG